MYEVGGIVYGSEPTTDMRVVRIKDVGDYILLVTFSTGETRLVDCTELFVLPAFKKILGNKKRLFVATTATSRCRRDGGQRVRPRVGDVQKVRPYLCAQGGAMVL